MKTREIGKQIFLISGALLLVVSSGRGSVQLGPDNALVAGVSDFLLFYPALCELVTNEEAIVASVTVSHISGDTFTTKDAKMTASNQYFRFELDLSGGKFTNLPPDFLSKMSTIPWNHVVATVVRGSNSSFGTNFILYPDASSYLTNDITELIQDRSFHSGYSSNGIAITNASRNATNIMVLSRWRPAYLSVKDFTPPTNYSFFASFREMVLNKSVNASNATGIFNDLKAQDR